MAEHPIKTRLKELRERLGQEEVRLRELKNEVEELILKIQDTREDLKDEKPIREMLRP
jgi:predicted  nucleic acid-binding Zn-ribbon protein